MFFPALVRPISALLVAFAVAPLSAQDYEWGKKMFDRQDVKFGSVAKNADVVFKFNVKNIYKEDILITSLSTSCGCISWQERDRLPIRITSGQTQQITIRLDTARHQGDKHVTAFASLSEPTRGSKAQLSIRWQASRTLANKPSREGPPKRLPLKFSKSSSCSAGFSASN